MLNSFQHPIDMIDFIYFTFGAILGVIGLIAFSRSNIVSFSVEHAKEKTINWFTVNNYAKEQEVFYYWFGFILIFICSILTWFFLKKIKVYLPIIEKGLKKHSNLLKITLLGTIVVFYAKKTLQGFGAPLDPLDDGSFLAWGTHFVNGKIPYKDMYITYYGPLFVYPYLILFKIFAVDIFYLRLFRTFLGIVMMILVYKVAKNILQNNLFVFLILLFMTLISGPVSRHLFSFAAILFMFKYLDKDLVNIKLLAASAVSSALSFYLSPETGVYVSLSLAIVLFLTNGFQKTAFFVLIGVITFISGFIPLYLTGALKDYLVITFIDGPKLNLSSLSVHGSAFPNFFNLGEYRFGYAVKSYSPIVIYLVGALFLFHRFYSKQWRRNETKVLIMLIFSTLVFQTFLQRPGVGHLYFIVPPLLILFFYLLEKFSLTNTTLTGLIIVFLIFAYYFRLNALHVSNDQDIKLDKIAERISSITKNEKSIFVFHDEPIYYYLTNKLNPTRHDLLFIAGETTKRQEILRDLDRDKTRYVVYSPEAWPVDEIYNTDRLPDVWEYITNNYYLLKEIDGVQIFERKISNNK